MTIAAGFSAPTAGTALEHVSVMQKTIQQGGDGGAIEQLSPVFRRKTGRDRDAGALVAARDDLYALALMKAASHNAPMLASAFCARPIKLRLVVWRAPGTILRAETTAAAFLAQKLPQQLTREGIEKPHVHRGPPHVDPLVDPSGRRP